MRQFTLGRGAAVGVALAAMLAPTNAMAAKHPSANGRCRIGINVAPPRITAGDPVVIFGHLVCPRRVPGQVVKLFHHVPGRFGFSLVQTTTTDANGFYEFGRADGVVDTNRSWFVRSRGAQSATKSIKVAAQVVLNGPPDGSQLQTGQQIAFSGTVNPADVGARVILQRQNAATGGDSWVRINKGQDVRVLGDGSFTLPHVFVVPGDANIRVLVRSQGRNVPSPSNVLNYQISQAQNPNLTIAASADPIAFGQQVTISGTLANGANQPVTLFARTDQQTFAPVAQAMTDGTGKYSFAPQMPVNNTFYQVSGGAQKSSVLFEGVKDVLTATASPTTVEVGQPVTFSGTVAPDHSGHVIYLERQNASGDGFHVIQVAHVLPGSSYSIVHQFYGAGTAVVRVLIPGGPENEGVASPTFTVTVTPAPAAALTPAPTSNDSPPSNGQQ